MTENEGESQWPIDSVANDHLRTSDGWIPFTRKSRADGPPWSPGDVVDGHVMTESGTWVSTGEATYSTAAGPPLHPLAAPPASLRQRWRRLPLAAKIALGVGAAWAVLAVVGLIVGAVSAPADEGARADSELPQTPAATKSKDAPKRQKPASDPAAEYAAKMQKRGWVQLTDGLWGKWDANTSDSFAVTWNLRVVSRTGCSNGVYVEANVMDSSNTVVAFTNDMLPSLPANQEAVLQLTSTAQGQLTVRTTKASCY